jgi:hypothetical protein
VPPWIIKLLNVPVEPGVTEVGVFEFTVSPKIVTGDAPADELNTADQPVQSSAMQRIKMEIDAGLLRTATEQP